MLVKYIYIIGTLRDILFYNSLNKMIYYLLIKKKFYSIKFIEDLSFE